MVYEILVYLVDLEWGRVGRGWQPPQKKSSRRLSPFISTFWSKITPKRYPFKAKNDALTIPKQLNNRHRRIMGQNKKIMGRKWVRQNLPIIFLWRTWAFQKKKKIDGWRGTLCELRVVLFQTFTRGKKFSHGEINTPLSPPVYDKKTHEINQKKGCYHEKKIMGGSWALSPWIKKEVKKNVQTPIF